MNNNDDLQNWLVEFFLHITRDKATVSREVVNRFLSHFDNNAVINNNKTAIASFLLEAANSSRISDPTGKTDSESKITTGEVPTTPVSKETKKPRKKKEVALPQAFLEQSSANNLSNADQIDLFIESNQDRIYSMGQGFFGGLAHYAGEDVPKGQKGKGYVLDPFTGGYVQRTEYDELRKNKELERLRTQAISELNFLNKARDYLKELQGQSTPTHIVEPTPVAPQSSPAPDLSLTNGQATSNGQPPKSSSKRNLLYDFTEEERFGFKNLSADEQVAAISSLYSDFQSLYNEESAKEDKRPHKWFLTKNQESLLDVRGTLKQVHDIFAGSNDKENGKYNLWEHSHQRLATWGILTEGLRDLRRSRGIELELESPLPISERGTELNLAAASNSNGVPSKSLSDMTEPELWEAGSREALVELQRRQKARYDAIHKLMLVSPEKYVPQNEVEAEYLDFVREYVARDPDKRGFQGTLINLSKKLKPYLTRTEKALAKFFPDKAESSIEPELSETSALNLVDESTPSIEPGITKEDLLDMASGLPSTAGVTVPEAPIDENSALELLPSAGITNAPSESNRPVAEAGEAQGATSTPNNVNVGASSGGGNSGGNVPPHRVKVPPIPPSGGNNNPPPPPGGGDPSDPYNNSPNIDFFSGALAFANPGYEDILLRRRSRRERELEKEHKANLKGKSYKPKLISKLLPSDLDKVTIRSDGTERRVSRWGDRTQSEINPNDWLVNEIGYAPIHVETFEDAKGRRIFPQAAFGNYGDFITRNSQAFGDLNIAESDYALLEMVARSRQKFTPKALSNEVYKLTGHRPQEKRAAQVLAHFGYDATDLKDRQERELYTLLYELSSFIPNDSDSLENRVLKYEDILKKYRSKGVGESLLGGIDKIGRSLGLNLHLSRFAGLSTRGEKVTWLEQHDKNSEFNLQKAENEKRLEELSKILTNKQNQTELAALESKREQGTLTEEELKRYNILAGGMTLSRAERELRKEVKSQYYDRGLSPKNTILGAALNLQQESLKSAGEALSNTKASADAGKTAEPMSSLTRSLLGKKESDIEKSIVAGGAKAAVSAPPMPPMFGNILKIAGVIGGVIYAFKKLFNVAVALGKTFYNLNKQIEGAIEKAAPYSTLTSMTARWFKGQEIRRELTEAQALEGSRLELAVSWSELKDAMQPLVIAIKDLINVFIAFLDTKLVKYLNEVWEFSGRNIGIAIGNILKDFFEMFPPLSGIGLIAKLIPDFKPSGDAEDYDPKNPWQYRNSREQQRKEKLNKEITKHQDIAEAVRKDGQTREQASAEWFQSQATIKDAKSALRSKGVDPEGLFGFSDEQIGKQIREFIDNPEILHAQRLEDAVKGAPISPHVPNAEDLSNRELVSKKMLRASTDALIVAEFLREMELKGEAGVGGKEFQAIAHKYHSSSSIPEISAERAKKLTDEQKEEYLAYYKLVKEGGGDLTINGKTYENANSMREAIFDRLDDSLFRFMDLLGQFGNLDENAKEIVSLLRRIAEEKDKAGSTVILDYLLDGIKEITGKGTKEYDGKYSKPWNLDPNSSTYGRWAGTATIEQRK